MTANGRSTREQPPVHTPEATATSPRSAASGHDRFCDTLVETRGVLGVFEVGEDGFLLSSLDAGGRDPEGVAAAAAITALSAERIGTGLDMGALSWILLEFAEGKMIIARRDERIWVVVATRHVVVGEILMKLKKPAAGSGADEQSPCMQHGRILK